MASSHDTSHYGDHSTPLDSPLPNNDSPISPANQILFRNLNVEYSDNRVLAMNTSSREVVNLARDTELSRLIDDASAAVDSAEAKKSPPSKISIFQLKISANGKPNRKGTPTIPEQERTLYQQLLRSRLKENPEEKALLDKKNAREKKAPSNTQKTHHSTFKDQRKDRESTNGVMDLDAATVEDAIFSGTITPHSFSVDEESDVLCTLPNADQQNKDIRTIVSALDHNKETTTLPESTFNVSEKLNPTPDAIDNLEEQSVLDNTLLPPSSVEMIPGGCSPLPISGSTVDDQMKDKGTQEQAGTSGSKVASAQNEGVTDSGENLQVTLNPPKSWASLLTVPSKGKGRTRLTFTKPDIVNGKIAIKVKKDEFNEGIKMSEQYLVGCFVGKRLAYPFVKESLTKLWEIKGDFEMTIQGLNVFFFKFSNLEDREKVLEMGSQHIASRVFFIREWRPFIEMETLNFTSIPVWVIIRNIPHHMRSTDGLSRIASTLGNPLYPDRYTEDHLTSSSFARVCIEVSATSEWPNSIQVFYGENGEHSNVQFEYAWIPVCCNKCQVFGRSKEICEIYLEQPPTKKVNPASENSNTKNTDIDDEGFIKPNPKKIVKANKVPSVDNHKIRYEVLEGSDEEINCEDKIEYELNTHKSLEGKNTQLEADRRKEKGKAIMGDAVRKEMMKQDNILLGLSPRFIALSHSEVVRWVPVFTIGKLGFDCWIVKLYAECSGLSLYLQCPLVVILCPICFAHKRKNCPLLKCTFENEGTACDFNAITNSMEKVGGIPVCSQTIIELLNCIQNAGSVDSKFKGSFLTWSNKNTVGKRVAVKLDRVLMNSIWVNSFNNSESHFQRAGVSDHSPCVLNITNKLSTGLKPFKFFNCWADKPEFLDVVKKAWDFELEGNDSYVFVTKLKVVKKALKDKFYKYFTDMDCKLENAKVSLDIFQDNLQMDPLNQSLAAEEKTALGLYTSLLKADESIKKQKSRAYLLKAVLASMHNYGALSSRSPNPWIKEGEFEVLEIFLLQTRPAILRNTWTVRPGSHRSLASSIALHRIGNGQSTKFWQDPWHPKGILSNFFPQDLVEDISLNFNVKVSNFIQDSKWIVPTNSPPQLNDIWEQIDQVECCSEEQDELVWSINVDGKSRAKTVTIHELEGIEYGLKLAIKHCILKILVYSDSKTAIQLLTYCEEEPPWRARRLVESIKRLMLSFTSIQFNHVYRECNRTADHLTKIRPPEGYLELSPDQFDEDMKKYIQEDASGKYYFRRRECRQLVLSQLIVPRLWKCFCGAILPYTSPISRDGVLILPEYKCRKPSRNRRWYDCRNNYEKNPHVPDHHVLVTSISLAEETPYSGKVVHATEEPVSIVEKDAARKTYAELVKGWSSMPPHSPIYVATKRVKVVTTATEKKSGRTDTPAPPPKASAPQPSINAAENSNAHGEVEDYSIYILILPLNVTVPHGCCFGFVESVLPRSLQSAVEEPEASVHLGREDQPEVSRGCRYSKRQEEESRPLTKVPVRERLSEGSSNHNPGHA
ncbi:hypothetical protein GIB67_038490 [Kingdonia uniflora]|uniref:DUF4283 domain-containing protein n=1 Tax=Kingdonia uniflora TaxID=39325 RepID=A0A7J7NPF1_9MAGN|nr:hypothetical protein GIB67_038490 [Kingdonia uniflora]